MKLYMNMHLRRCFVFVQIIMMAIFRESSIKRLTLQYSVSVAKLSVEHGFLVLRVYNWGWIIQRSGVSVILICSPASKESLCEYLLYCWPILIFLKMGSQVN